MDVISTRFPKFLSLAVLLVYGAVSGQATKFAITAITPSSPTAGNAFSVTVQSQNASGTPTNVSVPTGFFFYTNDESDELGGVLSGTIPDGNSSVTVSGVIIYNTRNGVTISATSDYSGDILDDGTSAPFNVLGAATQLAFASFPATGNVGSPVSFSVQARRADNSIDASYTGNITVAKTSGPGVVSGTTTVSAMAGVATFNNVIFSAAGTCTLKATATGLTQANSTDITIAASPVSIFTNPITDANPSSVNPYIAGQTADTHITVSGIGRGSGLTAASSLNRYSASNWTTAAALDSNDYFEFTLTPQTGYEINFSSFIYTGAVSAGSPGFAFRSNKDSYTANIGSPNAAGTTISLTGTPYQNVTGAITFRLYGYGMAAAATTYGINDFTFMGNVSCVTPAAFTVTGGGTYCSSNPTGIAIGLSGSQVGISYQLKRNGNNVDSPIAGTGSAISFLNQTVAGTYTVVGTNSASGCGASLTMTGNASISANAAPVAGSISGGGVTVCSGTNSTQLVLSGHSGSIQWQSSSDGVAYANIPSATSASYTVTNLTATTYFRAVLSNGVCSPANTPGVVVNVNPGSVAGNISGAATVCAGTNNTTLTLSGFSGSIQWQSSADGVTFNNISGATAATYNAIDLVVTTHYRAVVTSGSCASATSSNVTITVNPTPVAGSIIGGGVTVCSGTNSTTLTLAGHTGSIQWQSSVDGISFTDIGGATSAGYNAINLSGTTYYRAVVTGSPCAGATTPSVPIVVSPAAVAGNINGGNVTVCSGSNNTVLTLNGSTGSVQWQSSSDNVSFSDISGQTGLTYTASNLTATTYYRAVLTSNPCNPAITQGVAVMVNPVSVAGSIGGAQTVCSGINSTILALSGNTGAIQWQSSSDNSTFSDIIGQTASTYTASNLTQTTYYRAVVTSGQCTPATTSSVGVIVSNAAVSGTITGGDITVCSADSNTVLTLSGSIGNIQWQSSLDNGTFSDILGETSTTYTAANLTATTYYRAVLTSAPCAPATSGSVSIMVNPAPVAGSVTGGDITVCTGSDTVLTLNGSAGNIQWQSSSDNVTFADISGETGTTYTAANLTSTTYYRATVTSSPCMAANTASVAITVGNTAVAGTISGGRIFCGGGSAALTLTGNTGSNQWQSSTDNVTFSDIDGETGAIYNATVGGTMYYRAEVQSGSCSDTSAAVSVSGGTTTVWDGTAWSNGAPDSGTAAVFEGNYTASADIVACSITVNSGAIVIPSGLDVSLNGALTVNGGSFTLENNANLLQATDAVNSGNIIVKRNSAAVRRQDYTLWSSPVAGQNLLAFSPLTVTSPTSRFYQYNSSTNLYNSITSPGSVNFADAKGYLIRVANNHPTYPSVWHGQFTGVPHNGNYDFSMTNGGEGLRFNCVGNPYPSPISMAAFVQANNGQITQTLYFWRETNSNTVNNAYCSWSPAGGLNGTFVSNGQEGITDPQGLLQTGQGFFVEATASGSQVSFTNAMRIGNNADQFFRPGATAATASDVESHRIWLNVTNAGGAFCQTAFGYMTDATDGYDAGIEGKYINDGSTELYSIVGSDKLVIQGRALPFTPNDVVPLGFKAETAGTYAIAIDHVDGLFSAGQAIYLKDNQTGVQYLLNDGAYSFTTEAGEFLSRFEVMYQGALGTNGPELENQITIVRRNGVFEINSGNVQMDNVRIFDIRGRLVKELTDIGAEHVSFAAGQANQVLIVKITSTGNEHATRKVIN